MSANKGSLRLVLKIVVVLVVVAAGAFFARQNFADTANVEAVRLGKAVDAVTGSLTVMADGGIRPLKSEVAGRVLEAGALAEDAVFKKGDVLLVLDPADIERAREAAKRDYDAATARAKLARDRDPALKLAKEQLEVVKRLHARQERSDKEVEAAELAVERIETNLDLADLDAKKAAADYKAAEDLSETQLKKMKTLAPFDGAVQTPMTFEGALVGAGDTVAMILSNDRVVTAKVSEDSIAKVKLEQKAKITLLAYPGEQFDAKVIRISETADDTQRFNVFLKVDTDPARLKHGSTGEARITVGERENQPLVPRRAVFNDNQVYVVKNGVVERRTVEVGFRALNFVEARAGLQPGESVIVDDLDKFYPGQRVRVPTSASPSVFSRRRSAPCS
jgi:RND family efflux transporter MFP subunit